MSEEIEEIPLCYFLLSDGSAVCLPCSDPPEGFTKKMIAPPNAVQGPVDPKMFVKQGAGE